MDQDEKYFKEASLNIERLKFYSSLFLPVTVVALTFLVNYFIQLDGARLKRAESVTLNKQKIYAEEIGKKLNIIFVYINDFGDFRSYCPEEIISYKREVDRQFFMYEPYWSSETRRAYSEFMKAAFQTFRGSGTDAGIRTLKGEKLRLTRATRCSQDWQDLIVETPDASNAPKYRRLITLLLRDTLDPNFFSARRKQHSSCQHAFRSDRPNALQVTIVF